MDIFWPYCPKQRNVKTALTDAIRVNEKPMEFRTENAAMNAATLSHFSRLISLGDRNCSAKLV
jgi:hypothetical protein